jgi:hypothetical protein
MAGREERGKEKGSGRLGGEAGKVMEGREVRGKAKGSGWSGGLIK